MLLKTQALKPSHFSELNPSDVSGISLSLLARLSRLGAHRHFVMLNWRKSRRFPESGAQLVLAELWLGYLRYVPVALQSGSEPLRVSSGLHTKQKPLAHLD